MSWSWYSQLTDSFKRRAGRYLINRYLGPFLEEGILLDQLSIEEGITLRNVAVNTDHINSMLEDTEAPIEFVDGFIQELAVTVPWSNLLKDNCFFQIRGLTVTAQVKKRAHPSQLSASIFHSMCESFSSKDVAEDCLREQNRGQQHQSNKSELPTAAAAASSSLASEESALGVEVLAQAIDSILMRVQVSFSDTTFRLEYVPTVAPRGLALEIKIGNLNYCGSMGELEPAQMTSSTLKKISFQDVTLRTDEFSFHKSDHDQIMHRSSVGSTEESEEVEDDLKPLIMASLKGQQELILRFVDTDHYGLPRSVEEVEINVGPLVVHAFPHQIHTVLEIIGAFSSTSCDNLKPSSLSSATNDQMGHNIKFGLESMLQESMYHKPLDRGRGWSMGDTFESSTMSTDFQPMPKSSQQKRSASDACSSSISYDNPPPETPVIKIKASSVIAVLLEKDEGVSKMGGQSNKVLAFEKMQQMATDFFNQLEPPSVVGIWDLVRQAKCHDQIKQVCGVSRLQIVGAPLNLTYEESNAAAFAAGNLQDFIMKLVLSIGRLSVKEVIEIVDVVSTTDYSTLPAHFSFCDTDVVRFQASSSSVDFKLVFQECPPTSSSIPNIGNKTRLNIDLSPCALTLDPGFVDRIYMLFFYR